ncbi:hypothetical protein BN1708_011890 [Verticillium longisporum]|uniref:Uncharacterized protein n=1 Tax=Verticillium longisporum TaxID=100787 RepID=A0A0G4L4Q2_VERLO|nr:hypothetical protein BN1708_011890 [Verticillium longisporum]
MASPLPPRGPPREVARQQTPAATVNAALQRRRQHALRLPIAALRRLLRQHLAARADDPLELGTHSVDHALGPLLLSREVSLDASLVDAEILDRLVRTSQRAVDPLHLFAQLGDARVTHGERLAGLPIQGCDLAGLGCRDGLDAVRQRLHLVDGGREPRLERRNGRLLCGFRLDGLGPLAVDALDEGLELGHVTSVPLGGAAQALVADAQVVGIGEGGLGGGELGGELVHGLDTGSELLAQGELLLVVLVDEVVCLAGLGGEGAEARQQEVEDLGAVGRERQCDLAGRQVLELEAGGAEGGGQGGHNLGRVRAREAETRDGGCQGDEGGRAVGCCAQEVGELGLEGVRHLNARVTGVRRRRLDDTGTPGRGRLRQGRARQGGRRERAPRAGRRAAGEFGHGHVAKAVVVVGQRVQAVISKRVLGSERPGIGAAVLDRLVVELVLEVVELLLEGPYPVRVEDDGSVLELVDLGVLLTQLGTQTGNLGVGGAGGGLLLVVDSIHLLAEPVAAQAALNAAVEDLTQGLEVDLAGQRR